MAWIAAGILTVIALTHSALGEHAVLKPLIASDGSLGRLPRWVTARILRFAWHLTSVAWVGLAATLVGAPPALAFAAVCLVSAAVVLACLPGHLSWPAFIAAGVLAWWSYTPIPDPLLWAATVLGVAAAVIAALFHVAWALGSTRGAANVLPQMPGTSVPVGLPGRVTTLAVAVALLSYASLAMTTALGAEGIVRWAVVAALVVFLARIVGEGKYVGLSKRVRDTGFARADDRYWTPIVGLLALSAAATLALGA